MAPERPARCRGLRADEPGSSDARADDGAGTASQQMDEGQGGALLAARAGNPRKRPVAVTSDEELWTRCTVMRRVSHAAEAEAHPLDVPFDLAPATPSSSRDVDSELMPPPPPRPPAPVAASAAPFDLSALLCVLLTLTQTLHQPGGSGSTIPSPAGGLRAAGLSFVGLPGLVPALWQALSCVPSARPGEAVRPTFAAARAVGAAGAMAAACAQAPPPEWRPEQPVAAAHAPVRASPAAVCSRSRAAAGAAAEAAAGSRRCLWRPAEAATRRAQLGSCWSRPDASWGGVGRVFGGRFGAMPVFMEKSWDRVMLFCRVMLVSMRGMCAFLMLRTLVYTSVCRTRVWRCLQEIT